MYELVFKDLKKHAQYVFGMLGGSIIVGMALTLFGVGIGIVGFAVVCNFIGAALLERNLVKKELRIANPNRVEKPSLLQRAKQEIQDRSEDLNREHDEELTPVEEVVKPKPVKKPVPIKQPEQMDLETLRKRSAFASKFKNRTVSGSLDDHFVKFIARPLYDDIKVLNNDQQLQRSLRFRLNDQEKWTTSLDGSATFYLPDVKKIEIQTKDHVKRTEPTYTFVKNGNDLIDVSADVSEDNGKTR